MAQVRDDDWIVKAQGGDRAAFMELTERYWGRVYRWVLSLSRCTHLSEDVTQETFLKAWCNLASFQPGTSFRAWLFRIASNRFLDLRRGVRGKRPEQLPETLVSQEPGPIAVALSNECQTRLNQACELLPTSLRSAFLLRVRDGLEFDDIGRILGVSPETARWRLFKARQFLLNHMGEYLDGSPT